MLESKEKRKKKALCVIEALRVGTRTLGLPAADLIARKYQADPFMLLISCLLSLRARDSASLPASLALFDRAKTPKDILAIPRSELENIIYSVGFYRQKAKQIHSVCRELLERFGGKVPQTEHELLSIKGVGRKTANLVLGLAFGKPAICVDTHVHRLSNALGLVDTKTPEQTEKALQLILPKENWIEFNKLLVMWGQNQKALSHLNKQFGLNE
jgi:endonuclease III